MLSNSSRCALNSRLSAVLRGLLSHWPTQCLLCGIDLPAPRRAHAHPHWCSPCENDLPRTPEGRCRLCGIALPKGSTCGECLRAPPRYDEVVAPFDYAFPVNALIRRFKFGGDLSLAPALADAMAAGASEPVDAFVAIPLGSGRLRSRGFNQSHELARHLARLRNVPLLSSALTRVVDTAPQSTLPWTERARNVRNAFVCNGDVAGLHVAVVDDVITTGATLNEAARVLKRAGALRVSGWAVARTQKHRGDPESRLPSRDS